MKLYAKVIPNISRDIIRKLSTDGDIEVEPMWVADAEQDMTAIMKQYLADEEAVNAATRDALDRRGLDPSQFNRVKREMAEQRGHRLDEDGIAYIIDQMLEFMLISRNIDEVFAEDHVMRRKIHDIFKNYLMVDEELDREVRMQLKHLQEGTSVWDIEYKRQMEHLRRIKGLL